MHHYITIATDNSIYPPAGTLLLEGAYLGAIYIAPFPGRRPGNEATLCHPRRQIDSNILHQLYNMLS